MSDEGGMPERKHYDAAHDLRITLTADDMALIRAALSAYVDSIEHAQKVLLRADVEADEIKVELRRLHAKFFQANRPEGRRF